MKKILILSIMFLVGCTSYVTDDQVNRAGAVCKNNGGLAYIHVGVSSTYKKVVCFNTATFFIQSEVK